MAIRFPVEAGHIMMFARAVGDANAIYADETYANASETGGVIAPPTFVQASAQFDPDYFLRPKIGQPWFGSGRAPSGLSSAENKGGGGGLHAEQHFEYHRPIRAGDVLHATAKAGKTWEREGRRSGKLIFSELMTEYRDQAGNLVVTARSVGVRTERPVDKDKAAPIEDTSMTLRASELMIGVVHTERVVDDLKRTQIVQYAGASGDYNPIHTDEVFATQVAGYPTVFAHGMLTMGMTARMLTNLVGDARLTKFGVRFTSQVWPGDTLDASAKVTALANRDGIHFAEFEVTTVNQNGVQVLSGYAEARIDP